MENVGRYLLKANSFVMSMKYENPSNATGNSFPPE
jgi:hypothetical protein